MYEKGVNQMWSHFEGTKLKIHLLITKLKAVSTILYMKNHLLIFLQGLVQIS